MTSTETTPDLKPPPRKEAVPADPGGHQVRTDGHKVEVRDYDGNLVRKVYPSLADELVALGLGDRMNNSIRLKLGHPLVTAAF